jgi:hypothetical protein
VTAGPAQARLSPDRDIICSDLSRSCGPPWVLKFLHSPRSSLVDQHPMHQYPHVLEFTTARRPLMIQRMLPAMLACMIDSMIRASHLANLGALLGWPCRRQKS